MKQDRQSAVLEIIRTTPVATQEELLNHLLQRGYKATQATVSRDIKQLHLIKSTNAQGVYCYMAAPSHSASASTKFERMFMEAVTGAETAGNIVVCKCHGGMAQAACAALDGMHLEGVVGTLAGEDTFLCITRQPEQAEELAAALMRLLHR